MPSMKEAIERSRDGLVPIPPNTDKAPTPNPGEASQLVQNPYQISPLPAINATPDSIRGFNIGGKVPQFRVLPPPPVETSTVSTTSTTSTGSPGSSVSSTTISVPPTISNASLTTTVLAPSGIWKGTVQMAKGFQLQSVNANSYCRIELYGSKQAQTLDQTRPVSQSPANTTQGIILDVVLLTSLNWKVLDCVGANMDNPQTTTVYATITNLSTASKAFTVSLSYVQLES
jgi:hypothetical protein